MDSLTPNQVSRSTAYEAARLVRSTAGTLLGLTGYNSLAGTQFIQVWDAAAAPVKEVFTVAMAGLTGADVKGKYFICHDATGSVYVWGDDSIEADPAPAGIDRGIAFTVVGDADDDATLAAAVAAALDGDAQFVSTAATTTATATQAFPGERTNAADVDTGATITTTVAGTGTLLATLKAASTANFALNLPRGGIPAASGIYVTNSSTNPTLTAGSADCYFTATFK